MRCFLKIGQLRYDSKHQQDGHRRWNELHRCSKISRKPTSASCAVSNDELSVKDIWSSAPENTEAFRWLTQSGVRETTDSDMEQDLALTSDDEISLQPGHHSLRIERVQCGGHLQMPDQKRRVERLIRKRRVRRAVRYARGAVIAEAKINQKFSSSDQRELVGRLGQLPREILDQILRHVDILSLENLDKKLGYLQTMSTGEHESLFESLLQTQYGHWTAALGRSTGRTLDQRISLKRAIASIQPAFWLNSAIYVEYSREKRLEQIFHQIDMDRYDVRYYLNVLHCLDLRVGPDMERLGALANMVPSKGAVVCLQQLEFRDTSLVLQRRHHRMADRPLSYSEQVDILDRQTVEVQEDIVDLLHNIIHLRSHLFGVEKGQSKNVFVAIPSTSKSLTPEFVCSCSFSCLITIGLLGPIMEKSTMLSFARKGLSMDEGAPASISSNKMCTMLCEHSLSTMETVLGGNGLSGTAIDDRILEIAFTSVSQIFSVKTRQEAESSGLAITLRKLQRSFIGELVISIPGYGNS